MTQGVSHELTASLDRQADEALKKYARSKEQGDAHLLALYRERLVLNQSTRTSASKYVFTDFKGRMLKRLGMKLETETEETETEETETEETETEAYPPDVKERFACASLFTIDKNEYELFDEERKQHNTTKQINGRAEVQGGFHARIVKLADWVVQQVPIEPLKYLALLIFMYAVSARINEVDVHAPRKDGHVVKLDEDFDIQDNWSFVHKNGSKEKSNKPRPPRNKVLMLSPEVTRKLRLYIKANSTKASMSAYYKQAQSQAKGADKTKRFEHQMIEHGLWELVKPIEAQFTPNTIRSMAITLFPYVHDISAVGSGVDQQRKVALTIQGNHQMGSDEYLQYTANRVVGPPQVTGKRIELSDDKNGLVVGDAGDAGAPEPQHTDSPRATPKPVKRTFKQIMQSKRAKRRICL